MDRDEEIEIKTIYNNINKPHYNFNYYNVRNNAWEFLIKNNVNEYPLNLNKILKQNNWYATNYKNYCNYKKCDFNKLINNYPDAFTIQDKNNNFLICFNERNDRQRIRFSIAHEIGHIVLKHLYEELSKLCDVSIESAKYRLKRFKEINRREMFYTNPKEKQLLLQLKPFLNNYSKKE